MPGEDEIRAARSVLERFLLDELPVGEFEAWLYRSPGLEEVLGADTYLELVGLDYSHGPTAEARVYVEARYERLWPGAMTRSRVERLCSRILDGTTDLKTGCRELASLARRHPSVVPLHFVGFDSKLDEFPYPSEYPLWNPVVLRERLDSLERYKPEIIGAVRELLERLAAGR